jgi:PAS domain S-box-containing protein
MLRDKLFTDHAVLVQFVEALGDAVILTDLDGKIVYWNAQSVRDFGYTSDEAFGKTISLIKIEENDGTDYVEVWDRLKTETSLFAEVPRRRKDGTIIWVQLRITMLRDNDGQPLYLVGVSRDVTEDILKKNKLLIVEAVLESMHEGVLISEVHQDASESILIANNSFRKLTGQTAKDLGTGAASELIANLFPDWNRNDGDPLGVSQSEVQRELNGKMNWFSLTIVPVLNDHGGVSHRMYMLRDISHRRLREDHLRVQNSQLRSTNMELDRMVYGVSHDLRAPLNSIIGLANLMRMEPYAKEASIYIDRITQSAERLNDFISNIIQYSKSNRTEAQRQQVDFGELFNISADLHRYTEAGQRIAFQYVNKDGITIHSDREKWQIVFNNLIGNSIKFSRNISNSYVKVVVTKNQRAVLISVEDNGTGIPKDRMDSVFEMFYRADNIRSGSGLGLYIVRETVHALGGKISVESQVNSMTKFTISIPLSAAESHVRESN